MKILKKIMTCVLTLVTVASMIGGVTAFAANENAANTDIGISVEKTASGVDLVVNANSQIASIEGTVAYNETSFNLGNFETSMALTTNGSRFSVVDSSVHTGEILRVHFTKKEGSFVATDQYDFGITFTTAVDADDNSYMDSWSSNTLTYTYQEEIPTVKYTVTFDSNGGSDVVAQQVAKDGTATQPVNPRRSGYKFAGWQLNGSDYDFATPVTGNITLVAKWTEVSNDAIDLSGTKIQKTVKASEGVAINKTFTFKVTPQSGAPSIFTNDETTITANAADTFEQALEPTTFAKGGVYKYVVEEVADADDTDWTYDTTKYYLEIEIEPNDQDDTLVLGDVIIHKGSESGTKVDKLAFENTYKPASELTVSKTVAGEGDNPMFKDKEFDYTINFTAPAVTNGDITVMKVDKDNNETALDNAVYGDNYTFKLKDGEKVVFGNVAEGTSYTVTETGTEYYTASAVVTSGGVQGEKQEGEYGKDLVVTNKTANGINEAAFTNTYSITPPTGLMMHKEYMFLGVFAALAGIGIFLISRRTRREED